MSRYDDRYSAPQHGHAKRHDPVQAVKSAIERADGVERWGHGGMNVKLTFGHGTSMTWVSFTPMDDQYAPDLNRKVARLRKNGW